MNRITIAGHTTNEKSPAYKLLEANPKHWSTVFINKPASTFPSWVEKLSKEYIALQFDDITSENKILKAPTLEIVDIALEWTKSQEDVLFCCPLGVSASAALAYVCACQEFYPEDAIKTLKSGLHVPNHLIVRLGKELLKDHKIWEVYQEWLDKSNETIPIEFTNY